MSFLGEMVSAQVLPTSVPGFELELGSIILLFSTTLLCGLAPLWVLKGTGRCILYSESRHRVLELLGCCSAGVFLASSLLNMVPSCLAGMMESFSGLEVTLQFPVPEFILAMGFLLMLVIEQVVLALREQQGIHMAEKEALLDGSSGHPHLHPEMYRGKGFGGHTEISSLSAVRVFILIFSLSLCSVFEGLAVGLQEASGQGLYIHLTLLLRKGLTAFSLGVKLTQNQLRRAAVTSFLLLFSATCPLGAVLGISFRQTNTTFQYQLACSTLQGLAAGSFFYIIAMDLLPHVLGSSGQRLTKITLLLMGFTVVTGLLLIKF